MTLLALALLSALPSVQVVDRAGKPVPEAKVVCVDPGPGAEPCRKVRCEAEGWISGEAAVAKGKGRCTLKPAVSIAVEVPDRFGGEVEVRLFAAGAKEPVARRTLVAPKPDEPAGVRARFDSLPAGSFSVELARAADGWACRADAGPLGPGATRVVAGWREPRAIVGKLTDAEGKPATGKTIRVKQDDTEGLGRWSCRFAAEIPVKSDASGAFRVPVDPAADTLVTAGALDAPDGFAWQVVRGIPSAPIAMKLEQPVRFVAKLVDEQEKPAACRYRFMLRLGRDGERMFDLLGTVREAACDAAGGIAIGPLPSAPWALAVRPSQGALLRLQGPSPAPGVTEDLGTLRLDRGLVLSVTVVDRKGAPVRGAKVTLLASAGIAVSVEGTTDDTGGVELYGLPSHAKLRLGVEAADFATKRLTASLDTTTNLRVTLDEAARIAGEVRDERGEPVAAARVSAFTAVERIEAPQPSNAEGRFRFDDAPAGPLRLVAEGDGYAPSSPKAVVVDAGAELGDVVLVLSRADTIRGRVLGPEDAPVAGARVRLGREWDLADAADPARAETRTSADGTFELRASPTPDERLVATAEGLGTATEHRLVGRLDDEVVLRMPKAAALKVTLGESVPEDRHLTVRDGAGNLEIRVLAGVRSALFEGLVPGRGEAAILRKGVPVDLVAGTTAEVMLGEGAIVEGTVVSEGRGVSGASVAAARADRAGGEVLGDADVDASGRFRLAGLPQGRWLFVAVSAEGRAEQRVDVPDSGIVDLTLEIVPALALVRVVEASTAKPVPLANVTLEPADRSCSMMLTQSSWGNPWSLGADMTFSDNGCDTARTGDDGAVVLRASAPGRYRVSVESKTHETTKREVTLARGETPTVVEVRPKKSAELRVLLDTDPPGLSGTLDCLFANGHHSAMGGVAVSSSCAQSSDRPDLVVFRVEGYGIGWAWVPAGDEAPTTVTVFARRGGRIVVPSTPDWGTRPTIDDGSGAPWGRILQVGQQLMHPETLPDLGPAWVIDGVPPGRYAVSVGGVARGVVEVTAGGVVVAR